MALLKLWCLFAACLLTTGCIHVHQLSNYEHYHVPAAPIAIIVSGDLDDYQELTDALASQMVRTYALFALEAQLAARIEKSVWALQPSTIVAIG